MKQLTGKQKVRIITLAIIVVYLLYGTLAYAWDVRMQTSQIDYVDSMQVDGTEMSSIANFFVAGTNGFISFITMVLAIAAMSVIALILLVPWRCIALRKQSQVTVTEWKISKHLLGGFSVCSLAGGLVILRFSNLLYLLLMTGILAGFIWLIAAWPMHSAYKRCEQLKSQMEHDRYPVDTYIPVIKASICNGEQVAGFKDKKTGYFQEVMFIRSEKDLEKFKETYNLTEVRKEY